MKYYYCPHPVIDHVAMKAAFDAIPVPTPSTSSSKGIAELYTLPVHVDFLSLNVEEEIAAELTTQGKATDKHHVSRIPFRGFEIPTILDGQEVVLYKLPSSLRLNPNAMFMAGLPEQLGPSSLQAPIRSYNLLSLNRTLWLKRN